LRGKEERFVLSENAVSYESGVLKFGIEPSGRYGGLGLELEDFISVNCLDINEVLMEILAREDFIDVLKIDAEGVEIRIVDAIEDRVAKKIRRIYLEAKPDREVRPGLFKQSQYGSVCRLINKYLN
jgi:hypothetical protein